MPPAFNLTGTWAADDGATYYLRQLSDYSVAWAGLYGTRFHRGIEFTNVFFGRVSADGKTLSGDWADVPRGDTYSSGRLSLDIVQSPYGAPVGPVGLRRRDDGSSGSFRASAWRRGLAPSGPFPLAPQDIEEIEGRVQRVDSSLADNNPPGRDFTVMWGTIQDVYPLKWPKGTDVNKYSYSDFLDDGWPVPGHDPWDGDLDFDLKPDFSRQEGNFWTEGWVKRRNHSIRELFDEFDQHFHCEIIMYGREGPADRPVELMPGWLQQGGNSVLVNGRPVNGHIAPTEDLTFQFGRWRIALRKGAHVRVTGVVARDHGHHDSYPPWGVIDKPPEIHPVYAVDVVQDFTRRPRLAAVNLTGAWGADDIGTYYLRQIGNTLWWLGLSRDQGRTFANVFHGTVAGENINGDWIDVPMGQTPVLGNGSLTLSGGSQSTKLLKTSQRGSNFGALTWTKLYDTLPPQVFGRIASPK
jgi:hypothetical protein